MPYVLADETADYLRASSVFAWARVFSLQLPNSPTDAIAVIPTGGIDRSEQPLSTMRLQILVRGDSIADLQRAEEVWKELAQHNIPLPSSEGRYVADHLPGPYYVDSNNAKVFTLNFVYQGLSRVA